MLETILKSRGKSENNCFCHIEEKYLHWSYQAKQSVSMVGAVKDENWAGFQQQSYGNLLNVKPCAFGMFTFSLRERTAHTSPKD